MSGTKAHGGRFGYGVVETTLITIIIVILGATTWFVHASTAATNKTLANTNAVTKTAVTRDKRAMDFATCKQSAGSKILETAPEKCVAADGTSYADVSSEPSVNTVKAPADSATPAAGTCQTTNGTTVTITLNVDAPSPRCSQVTANQNLTIINPGTQSVTVKLGAQSITVAAGQSGGISVAFGDYLQTGDHVMQTGMYGDSGPEIYLPAS